MIENEIDKLVYGNEEQQEATRRKLENIKKDDKKDIAERKHKRDNMLTQMDQIEAYMYNKSFRHLNRASYNQTKQPSELEPEIMTKFLESFNLFNCTEL